MSSELDNLQNTEKYIENYLQERSKEYGKNKELAKNVINIISSGAKVGLQLAYDVLDAYEEIVRFEPNILQISIPICLVADMHSQLFDMIKIIETAEKEQNIHRFLFLGDYVDRGDYPVETFLYLCCRKLLDPDNFFMIRGNHETTSVNDIYGLKECCMSVYYSNTLFIRMNEVFQSIPIAAVVNKKIFCVHAGISMTHTTLEEISMIDRFCEIPYKGPLAELTWSDPDEYSQTWQESSRGAGYVFGKPQVEDFFRKNKLEKIVRAHEVQPEGYKWFFGKKLLSLWSAAKYSECPDSKATFAVINSADNEIKLFPIEASETKGYPRI